MRYLSVCSGIEAASVAWEPLGWQPVAFAEIEKFPAAVLAHRWPHVPNLGDMTKINGADFKGKIDVMVGGTPCQSFSVAGLRGGLDDERGNLALEFVRIADESDPAFVIWENVPGIFSDRGNAFGCFLAALAGEKAPLLPPGGRWTNAGYVLGPRRAIAWRVLDAQYFGLAQRRKRVFLIGCPRNGADPRKILFEFDGLRRDFAPSRETRADVAGTLESSLGRSRGAGTSPGAIIEHDASLRLGVEVTQALTGRMGEGGPDDNKAQGGFYVPEIVAQAISCKWSKGASGPAGDEHHNLIATASVEVSPTVRAGGNNTGGNRPMGMDVDTCESLIIASALRGEGFDASEDGTGRQNLIVTPINTQVGLRHKALGERTGLGVCSPGDPAFTLQRGHSHAVCVAPPLTHKVYGDNASREDALIPMAFHDSQDPDVSGDVTHPLGTNQGQEACVFAIHPHCIGRKPQNGPQGKEYLDDGTAYTMDSRGQAQCVSVSLRSRDGAGVAELSGEVACTMAASQGGTDKPHVLVKSAVRRLTPVECARLQGFPDNHTLIVWGKKPPEECPDGPQYNAYGNSMATNVMRKIGEWIDRYVRENSK